MKDEVRRISKLVAEGKLSPEDAADLIDAFYASDRGPVEEEEVGEKAKTSSKDPFKGLVESIEKLTKEGMDAVNWEEVSKQAKEGAKKGIEAIKSGLEDISKGKVNMAWLSNQEVKEVSLPLTVSAGKILRIENPNGSVRAVGGFDEGLVTARAKVKGATLEDARQKAAEYTLIVEESDHLVLIRQPDVPGLSVDLEIQLSDVTTVEVRSESGNVSILDTRGGARVNSRSGNVELRGLSGPVDISVDSGDIEAKEVQSPAITVESKSGNIHLASIRGNTNARTASGNIELTRSGGKVISLESVSGNVAVDLEEPVGASLNVRTVSGNAEIGIPDLCDCRVSLSTLRGSVECGLELTDEAASEMRTTGRLGDGTGTLDVSSVTGNISLQMHDQAVV